MDEHWRPVIGAGSLYEVSDTGQVRSLHAIGRPAKGGILAEHTNYKGYKRVHLRLSGHTISRLVHVLVLEAFIGPRPSSLHQCNHKNGIKSDNSSENLEWVTALENSRHSVANGLWHPHKGEAHGRSKLTNEQVKEIRRWDKGETYAALARVYKISPTMIRNIISRRAWRHI